MRFSLLPHHQSKFSTRDRYLVARGAQLRPLCTRAVDVALFLACEVDWRRSLPVKGQRCYASRGCTAHPEVRW